LKISIKRGFSRGCLLNITEDSERSEEYFGNSIATGSYNGLGEVIVRKNGMKITCSRGIDSNIDEGKTQGDLVCGKPNCLESSGVKPLVRRVWRTSIGSKLLSLAVLIMVVLRDTFFVPCSERLPKITRPKLGQCPLGLFSKKT